MKKNVLVYGLISGALISAFIVISMNVWGCEGNASSMYIGYAAQLLALSLVFVGIKNYRDNYNGGVISFGKAFTMGLYISLIASTMYVVVWTIDYYYFMPDFMDKFAASMLKQAQSSHLSPAQLASKTAEIAEMKKIYASPIMVFLFTYVEILPTGLIVSLISALILKKKAGGDGVVVA
ncbi:DUF4199 domain-containing protein [Mucilaginibacter sp. HMF5004]|uniref:DUF4199 domain-containing protein n=1 Tax=Mucilaginibacter rivuli TaxID=2857527 RepID=UPI001C5E494D|nr:DUF4199 domain-containing protein [Mucilaginibacter rivuli]MBW4888629.1 DUF4199 domain-containing protein [Mucilaginibacter rivuli]